jgi:putative phosphoesterase
MKKIGLISDTHSFFDQKLVDFLSDVDEIWHAGDIGDIATADTIAAFKPLRAVCGNIDNHTVRISYHPSMLFECEDVKVMMTHIGGYPDHYPMAIREAIEKYRPTLFVCGHSHILKVIYDHKYELLHINPGAAGIYGFHKVRTAVRFVIDGNNIRDLEVGEWSR